MRKALKYGRLSIQLICWVLLTLALIGTSMLFPALGAWVAKIQLLPLTLAFSMGWFSVWLVLTLIFGRVYCSSVCPLGAMQDAFSRLGRKGKRGHEYHYAPARTAIRNATLIAVIACILVGISVVTSLIDPYSAYSRIAINVLRPAWEAGESALFSIGWLANAPARIGYASLMAFIIALITLGLIGTLAFRGGRTWCNTFCPVGTALGFISRYSVFHIEIDTDLCINCRRCEHACKSSCIDLQDHVIDGSRCVNCFDCLPVCPNDAISYTPRRKQLSLPMMQRITSPGKAATAMGSGAPNSMEPPRKSTNEPKAISRRQFMATGLIMAAAAAGEPIRAALPKQESPRPSLYVIPPGAESRKSFMERCTGCGLCVAHCPTGVIKPSTKEFGWLNMLHPVKHYDDAECTLSCVRCTELCPTGALLPLTPSEKAQISVGLARVIPSDCLSVNGVHCGMCAEVCPKQAITMKPFHNAARAAAPANAQIPTIDPSLCIGCGYCQHICPATPIKAIVVDGLP